MSEKPIWDSWVDQTNASTTDKSDRKKIAEKLVMEHFTADERDVLKKSGVSVVVTELPEDIAGQSEGKIIRLTPDMLDDSTGVEEDVVTHEIVHRLNRIREMEIPKVYRRDVSFSNVQSDIDLDVDIEESVTEAETMARLYSFDKHSGIDPKMNLKKRYNAESPGRRKRRLQRDRKYQEKRMREDDIIANLVAQSDEATELEKEFLEMPEADFSFDLFEGQPIISVDDDFPDETDASFGLVEETEMMSPESRRRYIERFGTFSMSGFPKRIVYDDGNTFILTGLRMEDDEPRGVYQVVGFDADTMRTMGDIEIDLNIEMARAYERELSESEISEISREVLSRINSDPEINRRRFENWDSGETQQNREMIVDILYGGTTNPARSNLFSGITEYEDYKDEILDKGIIAEVQYQAGDTLPKMMRAANAWEDDERGMVIIDKKGNELGVISDQNVIDDMKQGGWSNWDEWEPELVESISRNINNSGNFKLSQESMVLNNLGARIELAVKMNPRMPGEKRGDWLNRLGFGEGGDLRGGFIDDALNAIYNDDGDAVDEPRVFLSYMAAAYAVSEDSRRKSGNRLVKKWPIPGTPEALQVMVSPLNLDDTQDWLVDTIGAEVMDAVFGTSYTPTNEEMEEVLSELSGYDEQDFVLIRDGSVIAVSGNDDFDIPYQEGDVVTQITASQANSDLYCRKCDSLEGNCQCRGILRESPRPVFISEKIDAAKRILASQDELNQKVSEVMAWDKFGTVRPFSVNPEREGIAEIRLRGTPFAGAPATRRFKGETFIKLSPPQGFSDRRIAQNFATNLRRMGSRYRIVPRNGGRTFHVYRGGKRADWDDLARSEILQGVAGDLIRRRQR